MSKSQVTPNLYLTLVNNTELVQEGKVYAEQKNLLRMDIRVYAAKLRNNSSAFLAASNFLLVYNGSGNFTGESISFERI